LDGLGIVVAPSNPCLFLFVFVIGPLNSTKQLARCQQFSVSRNLISVIRKIGSG
jgi:hypothetical protein